MALQDQHEALAPLREYLMSAGGPNSHLSPGWLAQRLGIDEREVLGAPSTYTVCDSEREKSFPETHMSPTLAGLMCVFFGIESRCQERAFIGTRLSTEAYMRKYICVSDGIRLRHSEPPRLM